jgi:RNA-dependent RNA polymerase
VAVDRQPSQVLGLVAINWLIIADQSNESVFDKDCMTLAQLHSDAVDYPKSSTPVPLDKIPRLKFKREARLEPAGDDERQQECRLL